MAFLCAGGGLSHGGKVPGNRARYSVSRGCEETALGLLRVTKRRVALKHGLVLCGAERDGDKFGEEDEKLGEEVTVGDAVRQWMLANERAQSSEQVKEKQRSPKLSVLFVDVDNRSVSVVAEAVFADLVQRRGLEEKVSCYSAGVDVTVGAPADARFVEALMFRRKLDVSGHSAIEFEPQDVSSYDLIVCMDERTRSQVIYMTAAPDGKHDVQVEEKIRLLSSYCMDDRLRSMQFPTNSQYSREALKLVMSAVVDACGGLLRALIEDGSTSE
uniref:Phosphotyrosine protein phosphatase I domain-containing protein n=1 Tax=Erythrolobus australicus TaxID=1077150 RepID=A0A7S1XIV5_9RHOD